MKRVLVYTLVFLVLAIFSFNFMRDDAGYVLVSYRNTTYEMTLWFSLFCLCFLIVCIVFVFKLGVKFFDTLASSVSWISESQSKKASRKTQDGLVHFIEGNWRDAKRNLLSAAKHSDAPLVHYLASARSAYEMGDAQETQRLLFEAEKIAPENSLAVLLSQARIQLVDKKYEQSLATLQRAKAQSPHHPVILDLMRQVYWQLSDWNSLIDLLPALKNSRQLNDEEFLQFEQELFTSYLRSVSTENENEKEVYDQAWQRVPKHLRFNPSLVLCYGSLLYKTGLHDSAEALLRVVINKQWSGALVELYGEVPATRKKDQLATAEKWLRSHNEDAELLTCLARICLRNELWGKAKAYFESSLRLRESPKAYAELGGLLAKLGEHEKSTALYQKGLLLTTSED